MKRNTILLTCLLVMSLLAAGCGSKEPTESIVNLPVVGGESQTTAAVPQGTTAQVPDDTYPVEQTAEPAVVDPALAYPIDDSSPTYDADMRAYIEQILNGTYAIEDLFGKDDDQLRVILITAAQGRMTLSETVLDRAVDWLEKQ